MTDLRTLAQAVVRLRDEATRAPSNEAARAIAERRLREWLQRGDPRTDASLDFGGES